MLIDNTAVLRLFKREKTIKCLSCACVDGFGSSVCYCNQICLIANFGGAVLWQLLWILEIKVNSSSCSVADSSAHRVFDVTCELPHSDHEREDIDLNFLILFAIVASCQLELKNELNYA